VLSSDCFFRIIIILLLTDIKFFSHSIESTMSILLNPIPYHLLAYGTFLGSQLYQVHPWPRILVSSTKRNRIVLDQYQNLLPIAPATAIPQPEQASVAGLFPLPTRARAADGGHKTRRMAARGQSEQCAARRSVHDGRAELVQLRTSHERRDG
jgi:hypothetical protein